MSVWPIFGSTNLFFFAFFEAKVAKIDIPNPKLIGSNDYQPFYIQILWFVLAVFLIMIRKSKRGITISVQLLTLSLDTINESSVSKNYGSVWCFDMVSCCYAIRADLMFSYCIFILFGKSKHLLAFPSISGCWMIKFFTFRLFTLTLPELHKLTISSERRYPPSSVYISSFP